MRTLIICCILWIAGFGTVSAQTQSRFGNCVPGYMDFTIGSTFFTHVPMECAVISRFSEQGYYPTGTTVVFDYNGGSYSGVVSGYQFTWKPDNSITVEYMVVYVGEIGPQFQIKEVAVATDKVHTT